jgi:hypothetical protein
MWSQYHATCFFSARRFGHHPIANCEGVIVWVKKIRLTGVEKAKTDDLSDRPLTGQTRIGLVGMAIAIADLFALLYTLFKPEPCERPRLIDALRRF